MSLPPWILFPEILKPNNGQDNIDVADSIEYQIDAFHADEYVYSPDMQVENRSWDVVVSRAIWSGKKVLHIPRQIAKNCLHEGQQQITLVNEDKDLLYHCQILSYNRHYMRRAYIEQGFYDFVEDAELGIGDTLCFTVSVPPDFIEVTVIKREVAR
ncbi:unnamed protein product [Trifolium pratense]|uniref:Uncharacterized protein n=1 Tax=Trifolium pratense TaxID=57577 RepID=A0ACB0JZ10_TRIPR|nr:unnamed protein product [Trifolium pratense]